ncbi:MAG: ABC transporter [Ruminococcaceae bacterium]|nr:ABC transporter [Oscillospiraceae bacterium]
MRAIFKRELKAYFSTPVGFLVLAAYYFFLGIYFSLIYSAGSPDVSMIFMAMVTIIVFTMPLITMRLMSEDRRQKVDQVLLTSPVKLSGIVLGKFFAALTLFCIGLVPTVIFEMIVASKVTVNFMSFLYPLLGTVLLGGALIAIGMFISSLTESAVISAILTLVVNFLAIYMSTFASMITVPESATNIFGKLWAKIVELFVLVLNKAAFITVFESFDSNIFSIENVIYFLSIIVAFVFLSVRSLEKRRWS